MQLSRANIKRITPREDLVIPSETLFELPEKVLQFGTGVLLRGLPDYFIDKANRNGIFNGRIVIVKSTSNGGTNSFASQDGLYTLCVRGIDQGRNVEEMIINSAVSRVLSAQDEWNEILTCAQNPEMQLIISNTTEAGIILVEEKIENTIPTSFPGKLLAFLLERFKAFKGAPGTGMVIIPTELIIDNGKKLQSIVIELATINQLDPAFIEWLKSENQFCSSLVDRIVPGKLPPNDALEMERNLGYQDSLMIMAEHFRLWAIESSDETVKNKLSFALADDGVVIAPDIEKFRELKLRLLNGTHTFSCGLAVLAGFGTVKEAMASESFAEYVQTLAMQEIAPLMVNKTVSIEEARSFAAQVLDRFRNPFLEHQWMAITLQYSLKMKMRNVPLIKRHFEKFGNVPTHMSLGFAAYLLFMKCEPNHRQQYVGSFNSINYTIQDDHAAFMANAWSDNDIERVVQTSLSNSAYWEIDLTGFEGFAESVKEYMRSILKDGVIATINKLDLSRVNA